MLLTVYPHLLAQTLATFPTSELSIMGRQPSTMLATPYATYLPGIMGLGIFTYIAYGFLMVELSHWHIQSTISISRKFLK